MQHQQATQDTASLQSAGRSRPRSWFWFSMVIACVALLLALANPFTGAAARDNNDHGVAGAGKTIIEGGTGGTTPEPVTTLVAFHANTQGGNFECLALAPPQATGPGSGEFSVNVMYVTGHVTSVE